MGVTQVMIIILIRMVAELVCMVAAVTVSPFLYPTGNSARSLTALLIFCVVGRMVAVTPEDRAAFKEFQNDRLKDTT